ncbi:hypothetical protein DB30_07290 [Enhygromyxa salina]|uniref:Uncharacterized protein n=2 Tax=Enhygromyxa salina TaxID=215803 RepID=A0A0C1ZSH3_9BACT|nr:hypothetical protein DB30_07290 [Enhygromyxa salina]
MLSTLRIALLWILVLFVVPFGSSSLERERPGVGCEPSCACDEPERVAHAEDRELHDDGESPCEQDCDEDCSGCCDARVAAALVSLVGLPSMYLGAAATCELPALDAPGCRVAIGVFRPPRSLT